MPEHLPVSRGGTSDFCRLELGEGCALGWHMGRGTVEIMLANIVYNFNC